MARNRYTPPDTPTQDREPVRRNWALRVLIFVLAFILLPMTLFVARESWRAHTLLAFCKEARAGITFSELLALEERHSIDDSYLVQANFHDEYIDQAHSHDLEFRSHMMDPDFACAIGHDGHRVKYVQLLTLEGFDPN